MIRVNVFKQANYPVKVPRLRGRLKELLTKEGIVSDAEVNVAIVNEKKMRDLCKKYLEDESIHNVLSFTPDEARGGFVYPPDNLLHLGEIVICYPKTVQEAKKENKLIEDKVYELIEHGAFHLLGVHHK